MSIDASSFPYFFAQTIAKTTFIESPGAIDENGPLDIKIDLFEGVFKVAGSIPLFHLFDPPKYPCSFEISVQDHFAVQKS